MSQQVDTHTISLTQTLITLDTPTVEGVNDMAAIHNLSKEVAQITVRYFFVGSRARARVELVDHYIRALLQISESEPVEMSAVPSHISKLLAPINACVEHTQSEQQHAEVLRALAGI